MPDGYAPPPPPKDLNGGAAGPPGIDASKLPGLVVDDPDAKLTGTWTTGSGLPGYVGAGYRYAGPKEEATARYEFKIEKAGRYEVRLSYGQHGNRATNAAVTIESAEGSKTATVNQRVPPPLPQGFVSVGAFLFEPGKPAAVTLSTKNADGNVHADAVQLLPVP